MSSSYPVLDVIGEVKEALHRHPVVILQAPPGAGKSTVLPAQLLNEPWLKNKKIVMLEPRRLAARSVAHRIASLLNERAGETVGYRIRFEQVVSERSQLEVLTEGILTRLIQSDNSLEETGLVIFDEFHERSLQADLALALTLQVQSVLREDLRILIMSATLDGERLSSLLGNAPVISSQGRQYPVTIEYYNVDPDAPLPIRMTKAIRKVLQEQVGDVLAFLPGTGDIIRTQELLETGSTGALVLPLYGDLPFKKQQEAILPDPQGRRKIVLATSIAETSLTIEGITTVIDSGFSRVPRFDLRSGLTRLETIRVTRDAADQRAGRAGRLGPGVCYRLWSEGTHQYLVPNRNPEILDADLAPTLLELMQWGVKDINDLFWLTPPPLAAVSQAKELLQQLDAIDNGQITKRGKEMVKLPTHPRLAHILIEASSSGKKRLALAADIASLLEERDPLPKESGADLTLRLELLRKWRSGERINGDRGTLERIERLATNWRKLFAIQPDNLPVSDKDVGVLVAAAYPERIARQTEKHSERYKLVNNRVAKLPTHDPLTHEPWLAVAQLDAGQSEGKIFLAAPLDEQDLYHLSHKKHVVRWNDERGMIEALEEHRIGSLVLASKISREISPEERSRILCEVVRNRGLKILGWSETQATWQARIMSLRLWRPQENWPDVSEQSLLSTLEEWLSPYLGSVSKQTELERLELTNILEGLIPWDLQSRVSTLAAEKLQVPSGSMIRLTYFADGRPPVMEVRLQEVFGLLETPSVNEGRTKVIMHLLSPGFKPVQVTQDLRSFWTNTYTEVRRELRMRYPKHHWPEDPWTAEAVRGVKRTSSQNPSKGK